MSQPQERKKKKGGLGTALWVVFLVIAGMASSIDDGEIIIALLIVLAVGVCVYGLIRVAVKAASREKPEAAAPRRSSIPAPERKLGPLYENLGRKLRGDAVPDAHCVVCENTGEDHFARDRRLRIRQLDEWLKNGIIDKAEYRVLKERYQRDT